MIPFVPNDTTLVGRYYVLDHDDYTDVIVGPEPEVPGMRGAILAGHAAIPLTEPVMLKVHGPPFQQTIRDGEDPETGEPYLRDVFLVVVTDRQNNVYLVHWNSCGCFIDFNEALRYREEQFDRLKLKQLLDYGGENSPTGKSYLRQLANYEDLKNERIELAKRNREKNLAAHKVTVDAVKDVMTAMAGVPKKLLFTPGKS